MFGNCYQGRFVPKHPEKYKGDPTKIFYRSSWELKFMMECDRNENIIEYQSEETIVMYRSPVDGNLHRYFPDFVVKVKDQQGNIKTMMIEIKPFAQTQQPKPLKKGKKPTKRFINEVQTYMINEAKWNAAKEFCADRAWDFRVLTEKELFKRNK